MSSRQALAFGGVASLLVLLAGCQPAKAPEAPLRAVRTQVISETGGALDREFSGDIRARTESRLSFRVPGKITARQVDLGQSVRPGQTLAQIDATDLRLNQEAAKAGLSAAEATAVQAAADLKRFQDLRAQGFISAAELDRHVTSNKNAQAQLTQARAQANVQGNQAAYGTLTATAAGVITSVDAEPGQVVSAGQPVVTLAHDGPRDVVFSVPEDMGPTVRPLVGKTGALKVRRWGSDQWSPATIREMAAATDPTTRTFLVKADVNRLDAALGQTATVALAVPSRLQGGGVQLPLNALVEQGGKSAVWVLDPKSMTVARQPVVTAEVNGNIILVAAGLRPGQEVVTAGVHVLTQGQKVRRLQVSAAASAANSR
ncbi:MAG TPA: efflux RND transporter periplasmic adaptor subunit [Candidatus Aquabacterium excrementipullorum]|nr:efflux RND transporter periplasmic adaptor subunit [Candidatus Aquabacterium excrementipullorum]